MPPDVKTLSPEVEAARQAVAADKLRAKKQAQAEINAQNREMKKQLATLGPAESMAAAIDAEAKAAAPPPAVRSLTTEEHKLLAADIAKKQKRALKRVAASSYGSSDGAHAPPRPGTAPGPATRRLRASELVGSCALKSPSSAAALPPLSAPGRRRPQTASAPQTRVTLGSGNLGTNLAALLEDRGAPTSNERARVERAEERERVERKERAGRTERAVRDEEKLRQELTEAAVAVQAESRAAAAAYADSASRRAGARGTEAAARQANAIAALHKLNSGEGGAPLQWSAGGKAAAAAPVGASPSQRDNNTDRALLASASGLSAMGGRAGDLVGPSWRDMASPTWRDMAAEIMRPRKSCAASESVRAAASAYTSVYTSTPFAGGLGYTGPSPRPGTAPPRPGTAPPAPLEPREKQKQGKPPKLLNASLPSASGGELARKLGRAAAARAEREEVGKSEHGLALRKRLARKRAAEARAERGAERLRAAEAAEAAEAERAAARVGRNAVAAAADGARRRSHARSMANAAAAEEAAVAEANWARQRAAEAREAAEARTRVRCTTLVEEDAGGGWQVNFRAEVGDGAATAEGGRFGPAAIAASAAATDSPQPYAPLNADPVHGHGSPIGMPTDLIANYRAKLSVQQLAEAKAEREERLAAENAVVVVPQLGSLAERAETLGVTLHAGSAKAYL